MKHLLLLLFTTACLAQNAKVTAYRLTDDLITDGPCSIVAYVKGDYQGLLTYVTAESNDASFAQKLLDLKKSAKKWKQQDFECNHGTGWDMLPNMFVIKGTTKNDTVFTNYNNTVIIFPNKKVAYTDKKHLLKKSFPKEIKNLYNHNFSQQIRSLVIRENDSISTNKVIYEGKLISNIINSEFENHPGKFKLVSKDSLFNDIERIYTYDNDTIRYHRTIEIIITNPDSDWNVGGLKIGDTEEKFRTKYPTSARVQKYYNIRYEDIIRQYFYWVMLSDNKGSITYVIKDQAIEKIEIDYNP